MRGVALALVIALHGCGDDGGAATISDAGTSASGPSDSGDATPTTTPLPDPTTSEGSTFGDASSSTDDANTTGPPPGDPGSLRFFGNGGLFDDRVLIRIDDPETDEPGPPLDVGDADFTVEFWVRPDPDNNPNQIDCSGNAWTGSNIVVDRDRHTVSPAYGVGVANSVMVFAVDGDQGPETMCGQTSVMDDAWHHVAVQRVRSTGSMTLYVDGALDAQLDGPTGDISYPDDAIPLPDCPRGMVCDYSDPFLCFGAEKHGYSGASFSGWLDEVRISTTIRYDVDFDVPTAPFDADAATVGLFHFGEGQGNAVGDSSPNMTNGEIRYGGNPPGPLWSAESPF